MKVRKLKELLANMRDDDDVYIVSSSSNFWLFEYVNPACRLKYETVVWDANGSYRLMQEGQSVMDHEDDPEHQPLRVLVLK